MHIKAPRLYRNRCGVYDFRVKSGKKRALRALEENKAAGRHASVDIEVNAIGKQTLVE